MAADSPVSNKLNMSLDDIIQNQPAGKGPRGRSSGRSSGRNSRGGVRKVSQRNDRNGSPRRGRRRNPPRKGRRSGDGDRGEDEQMIEEGIAAGEFIKVSGDSIVKAVAGKLAHDSRAGDPPAMLAKGPESLNQAIKAVAVARSLLKEEGLDITCQPAFRDDKQHASLALYLAKRKPINFPKRNVAELTCSSHSDPRVVAGALANRVREDKPVCLSGIGHEAVSRCIRSICHGRLYLEENRCDIKALVEFMEVEKNADTLTAVRFNIIVEDV